MTLRSMFSAVSGLRNHQTRLDVIGNNISNVNTVGFKAGRVTFQDIFSQTLRGAGASQGTVGGINPVQVGLGSKVGTIDTMFTQGNFQTTGRTFDLSVEGDGFFTLSNTNIPGGGERFFTRAGNFDIDARPSDAIALALRFNAPIYVEDAVMQQSKISDGEAEVLDTSEEGKKWADYLENLSPDDFGKYKV